MGSKPDIVCSERWEQSCIAIQTYAVDTMKKAGLTITDLISIHECSATLLKMQVNAILIQKNAQKAGPKIMRPPPGFDGTGRLGKIPNGGG